MTSEPANFKVSVVIPITRMAGRLTNLTKTFENCSCTRVEFILVHDEQDKETQNEIEDLQRRFNHLDIQIYRKTLMSPGLARNYGVTKITGSWFCFSDSDDLPQICNILRTAQMADEIGAEIAIGNLLVVNGQHERLIASSQKTSWKRKDIAALALNPGFTRFVFKSSIFRHVQFPQIKMGEDQVYLARTNFFDFKIYSSDLLLYKYFLDVPNQATKNNSSLQELYLALHLLNNLDNGRQKQMQQFIHFLVLRISLTCIFRKIQIKVATKRLINAMLASPANSLILVYAAIKAKSAAKS
jgi:glycosyltransferase involved in cell wall biosynthesis